MNYLEPEFAAGDVNKISILGLAYVGDCVYELLVRTWLLSRDHTASLDLHRTTVHYVNAVSQAEAWSKISGLVTEEESAVFRRGRNAKVNQVPRNATAAQYHTATGLEALFGWLYLRDRQDRIGQLFQTVMDGEDD